MKKKMHQRIFAIILCIAMILTSINITNLLNKNIEAATGGNLAQKRTQATSEAFASFKYATTNLRKWNGSKDSSCYNSSTNTFNVYTPEQFAYAIAAAGSYANCTINVFSDLDMNGSSYYHTPAATYTGVKINGNNHIIYNLRTVGGSGNTGLCSVGEGCSMTNITFENMFMHGTGWHGLIAQASGYNTNWNKFDKVYVNNSLAGDPSGVGYGGALGGYGQVYATNCGTNNFTSIGNYHVGGLFGLYEPGYFNNCYSANGLVVNFGGHGGGFASCSDTGGVFENSWCNNTCYGTTDMGGFTSGCDGNRAATGWGYNHSYYTNCFSAGVVESDSYAGGFFGHVTHYSDKISVSYTYVTNCYSTAMVGMNYNAGYLGGFTGVSAQTYYKNCYAAGEVGSIDTNINTTGSAGGFIGQWNGDNAVNCYYDMQTTAMKNKAIGNVALSYYPLTRTASGVQTANYAGITGVTTKILTNATDLLGSEYKYENGLYPQIATLANSNNVVDKAFSAASTSTVFCDEWSDISTTGFDTIRDTMRNMAFTSNLPFTNNPQFSDAYVNNANITSINWKVDGNKTPIDQKTAIITLSGSSPYYTTALNPGIEWAEVNLTYKDSAGNTATGSRRLRLIPTSVIKTGSDTRVDVFYDSSKSDLYTHKTGFATTYIDNTVLQNLLSSTAANPTYLKTFDDVANQAFANNIISGTISLLFNSTVKTLNVTATTTDKYGNSVNVSDLQAKLNGTKPFTTDDTGNYRIQYKMSLADGRYLSIAKNFMVVIPYSVEYFYNYTGLIKGENIYPNTSFYIQQDLKNFNNFDLDKYGTPPARDGYYFSHWSLDPEGNQPVNQKYFDTYESVYGELTDNVSLYAQWKKISDNVKVEGSVTWKDNSNKHLTRPNTVEIFLYRNGTLIDQTTLNTAGNKNTFSFDNLSNYNAQTGEIYYYTVSQSEVISNFNPEDTYTTDIDATGFHFTNELINYNIQDPEDPVPPPGPVDPDDPEIPEIPESYQVEGTITWVDNSDELGYRPYDLKIILYQNGVEYSSGPYTVTSDKDVYTYLFTNLPKYDNNKELYVYTVKQQFTKQTIMTWDKNLKKYVSADAYTVKQSGFNFTNTLIDAEEAPIIPVKPDHTNTLTFKLDYNDVNWNYIEKTSQKTEIMVTLKQMETIITNGEAVYTTNYNGMTYNSIVNYNGITINNIPSGKFEIITSNDNTFNLDNVKIETTNSINIVKENNKWYLIISETKENQSGIITFVHKEDTLYGYDKSYNAKGYYSSK